MNVYILMVVVIVLMAIVARLEGEIMIGENSRDYSNGIIFILPITILLVLITGLRHNMNSDYIRYEESYLYIIRPSNIKQLMAYKEIGFSIFQKLVGEITRYSIVSLMIVMAFITVSCYFITFRKYSEMVWLSTFMLVTIGSYYTCFNTTRNFLVTAMFLVVAEFIYQRRLLAYFLGVIFLASFHYSAILMIPMYWVLPYDWRKRKMSVISIGMIGVAFIIFLNINTLVSWITQYFYSLYSQGSIIQSGSIIYIVRPLFLMTIVLLNYKQLDFESIKERTWFNATLLFVYCYAISYKFAILYRFTYYFLPFILLLIPNIIKKQCKLTNRIIWTGIILVFAMAWNIMGQFTEDYKFYWQ